MIEKLRTLIITIIWWSVLFFDALFFALFLVLLPHRFRNDIALRMASKVLLKVAGVKVKVSGLENILKDKPQIFVANHQSWFDSFVLSAILLVPITFVSKKEMFRVPIYSYIMRRLHFISIDRDKVRTAVKSIDNTKEVFKNGLSIVVFPEGTISKTGELGQFKRGSALLAAKAQIPIVPVALKGMRQIKRRESLWIDYGIQTEVRILEPVMTYSLDRHEQKKAINKIRNQIEMVLTEISNEE